MKLRIWKNCRIVAELAFDSDGDLMAIELEGDGGLIAGEDHISIDPWNKLAGEEVGRRGISVNISLDQASNQQNSLD